MATTSLSTHAHAHKSTTDLWKANCHRARVTSRAVVRRSPPLRKHHEDIENFIAVTSTMRGQLVGPNIITDAIRLFGRRNRTQFNGNFLGNIIARKSNDIEFEFLELVTLVVKKIPFPRARLWFRLVAIEGMNPNEAMYSIGGGKADAFKFRNLVREILTTVS